METLTLLETKVALEGITIGGKSLQEHLEAVNHRVAILLLEEMVQKGQPRSEWTRSLHQLILKGIDDVLACHWAWSRLGDVRNCVA